MPVVAMGPESMLLEQDVASDKLPRPHSHQHSPLYQWPFGDRMYSVPLLHLGSIPQAGTRLRVAACLMKLMLINKCSGTQNAFFKKKKIKTKPKPNTAGA